MKFHLTIILFILTLLCPHLVLSATYYVGQSSSGTGTGNLYKNRMSVSTHNSFSFKPGDIIFLCDTIYSAVDVPSSGTADQRITYRGDHAGHEVIIDLNNSMKENVYGIRIYNKDYITIESVTIRNAGNGITIQTGSDFIDVIKCEIYDCGWRGIQISSWKKKCTNITIGGSAENANTIRDCGTNTASADIISGANVNITVSYNHLYATRSDAGIGGVWMVGANGFLIEHNSIHDHNKSTSGGKGEGGISCKYSSKGIIRYNHIFNHNLKGAHAAIRTSGNSYDIRIYGNVIHDNAFGIHPNDAYNHPDGCGDGISQHDIYIYGNLIFDNFCYGIVLSYGGRCSPDPAKYSPDPLKNIHIYNNVIAKNGSKELYGPNATGLTIRDEVDNVYVRNNIFYQNRPNENSIKNRFHISTVETTNIVLENNQYFWPETIEKNIIDWNGKLLTLHEIKSLNHEDDVPPGSGENPGFQDPNNDDYTLSPDSVCKDNAYNLGEDFAQALDPINTNWSKQPPIIKIINRPSKGFWERGAFGSLPNNSGSKLKAPDNLRIE